MKRQFRILLQTTIPTAPDDLSISRFSRLADFLRQERNEDGAPLFDVTARDRDPLGAPDAVLSSLDISGFDELWLFAVDAGNGIGKIGIGASRGPGISREPKLLGPKRGGHSLTQRSVKFNTVLC